MSFRRFVYWCALCGGWAAAAGWGLGRLIAGDNPLGSAGVKGMCLGLPTALALGLVDAMWVYSLRQLRHVVPRVVACVAVGTVGGLLGGFVGQLLFDWKNLALLLVIGWVLTGLMVGVSLGTFDFLRGWVLQEDLREARRKILRGTLGGTMGGLLGGFLYWYLRGARGRHLPRQGRSVEPECHGLRGPGIVHRSNDRRRPGCPQGCLAQGRGRFPQGP